MWETPGAAHRGHLQGPPLPNGPPGGRRPPPVPVGAASGGQNIDYFFTFSRRGRPASRPKATPQLLFVGVALGDGVACAPGCRWRGGRGGGMKKNFTVTFISNLIIGGSGI